MPRHKNNNLNCYLIMVFNCMMGMRTDNTINITIIPIDTINNGSNKVANRTALR